MASPAFRTKRVPFVSSEKDNGLVKEVSGAQSLVGFPDALIHISNFLIMDAGAGFNAKGGGSS